MANCDDRQSVGKRRNFCFHRIVNKTSSSCYIALETESVQGQPRYSIMNCLAARQRRPSTDDEEHKTAWNADNGPAHDGYQRLPTKTLNKESPVNVISDGWTRKLGRNTAISGPTSLQIPRRTETGDNKRELNVRQYLVSRRPILAMLSRLTATSTAQVCRNLSTYRRITPTATI